MARPFPLLSSLRHALPTTPSPVAGPSSLPLRPFSTSSPALISSKRKLAAKRKKASNLALQASRRVPIESVDPILARTHYRPGSAQDLAPPVNPWKGCRLQRILLDYNTIAYAAPVKYDQGERPEHFLPGFSEADGELLFGAVPHAAAELRVSALGATPGAGGEVIQEQTKQTEMMMRVLDLRHANKATVNAVNRKRIIDEFGGGVDTGSSAVQAALLTAKIHNLLEHVGLNSQDKFNKRALRLLVQQRARHLKFWARNNGEQAYVRLLADLGLERAAVEGELRMPY
ncbi:ribosomal protein S15 [Cryptococcus sp. DSM 104549]